MVDESVLKIAQKFVSKIPHEYGMTGAYLFGSYANNKFKQDSDIDIALILSSIGNFFETQIELMKLRREIDLRIEVHPFSPLDFTDDNPLAFEIKRTGIPIN